MELIKLSDETLKKYANENMSGIINGDMIRMAADLLQLREQTRWIPVGEKLPEEHVPVLVLTSYGAMDVCKLDFNEPGYWFNAMRPQHSDGNVTHWMPLPPSPEPDGV